MNDSFKFNSFFYKGMLALQVLCFDMLVSVPFVVKIACWAGVVTISHMLLRKCSTTSLTTKGFLSNLSAKVFLSLSN